MKGVERKHDRVVKVPPGYQICPECGGSGGYRPAQIECSTCKTQGYIKAEDTGSYGETRPAPVESNITCKVCKQQVARITFLTDGGEIGVCACSWTSWLFQPDNKVYRSTIKD